MNKKWTTVLAVLACLAVTGAVWAQVSSTYDNRWHVLSAGGSQGIASSNYTIHGTSGQFAIGPASGGQSAVGSGYWYGIRLCEPITGVDFGWTPPSPETGDVVTFTVTSILPITATPPITYEWGFGDGGSATGDPAHHTYTISDTYTVNLSATNACGGPVYASHDVIVTGPVVTPTYGVELTPPTASEGGAPDDTVVYNLTVHNTGDTADVFDLSFTDIEGWTTGVAPASVSLVPDGTAPVSVTVDIPSGANDGEFDVTTVTATSQGDPAASDSSTLTTTALVACEPITGVDFDWTPLNPSTSDVVTFTASYQPLTATPPITSEWSFGDGGTGEGSPIVHQFLVSDTYAVNLSATNPCGGPVYASHAVTVTGPVVTPIYGVELTPPTASEGGAPGDTVVYTMTVHNTGDAVDTFDLSYIDVNGWTSGVAPASVSLPPDGTAPLIVTVDIPSGAGDGDFDVTTVTATSQGDPAVSDSSVLTTTSAGHMIYMPVVFKDW